MCCTYMYVLWHGPISFAILAISVLGFMRVLAHFGMPTALQNQ